MTTYERIHEFTSKLIHYSKCIALGNDMSEIDINETEERESFSTILNKPILMNDEDPKWVKIVIFILVALTFGVLPLCFIYFRFYH